MSGETGGGAISLFNASVQPAPNKEAAERDVFWSVNAARWGL